MKKFTVLAITFALVMSLVCIPAGAENTSDFVNNPVVLDFDDYKATQSVSEYLASLGWGGNLAEITGGKAKLTGTGLNYVSTVGFDPDADANLGYNLVLEYDAQFTDLVENEFSASYGFPVIGSGTSIGSKRALRGTTRHNGNVDYAFGSHDNLLSIGTDGEKARSELNHTWVFDFGASGITPTYDYYITGNGVNAFQKDAAFWGSGGYNAGDALQYFTFATDANKNALMDNIKIYAVNKNFAFVGKSFADTDVALDEELEFTFNNPVREATLGKVSVSTAEGVVDPSLYDISLAKDEKNLEKIVKIKFKAGMMPGETYTVTFPMADFTDTARSTLAEDKSVTFTAAELPEFSLNLTADKTLIEAAGKSINVDVTATNIDTKEANALILVGLYDSEGNLVKFASVSKKFAANTSQSFGYSFAVPEEVEGMSVKAIACANTVNLIEYASAVLGAQSE